ncbi:MAG TPA: hypothetical protein VLE02_01910 [Nitrosarchaeum sp.]|nr:hypothetical protein [Nitrosarchaeum sp.]
MSTFADSTVNTSIYEPPTNSGFRPQLNVVAAGSYVSNAVYGSNAASTGNYETVTLRGSSNSLSQTVASYTKNGKQVSFSVQISLNGAVANPIAVGGSEVRIRVLPTNVTEPEKYISGLPLPDGSFLLPLFEDVEVIDQTGTNLLPNAVNSQLQARILYNGDLALVNVNLAAGPPPTSVGLTAAILGALFATVGRTIKILVRGTYMAK